MLSRITSPEHDPRVAELRARLDAFYAKPDTYESFDRPLDQSRYWRPVFRRIREILERPGRGEEPVRVLEIGSGRTSFPGALDDLRENVHFTAQDITEANLDHLNSVADRVHVGDVLELGERFDVMFSTFVWEHITNPREVLEWKLSHLNPGGSVFIFCPRYDAPGYVPPSARHLSGARQKRIAAALAMRRVASLLKRRADFLIHLEPAVLHVDWYRDADAIHWSSLGDLRRALPSKFKLSVLAPEGLGLVARRKLSLIQILARIDAPDA